MEFTKPVSFAKQIAIYLRSRMDEKAYQASKDFVKQFPGELMAHVLLAESAFRLGRFSEAKVEGRKALRYATSENDMVFCAMVFSSACFHLKDYIEGYRLLKEISSKKSIVEVEEALFVFSLAMKDEEKAIGHMKNLLQMNHARALELMRVYLHSLPSE
ncbi:MAG: hypothetical protein AB1324_00270 [Candidatus Micrarchaeota archaeon]